MRNDAAITAEIVGTLSAAPAVGYSSYTGGTLRYKILTLDSKGRTRNVRLIVRGGAAFESITKLAIGDEVRVSGALALLDESDDKTMRAQLTLEVASVTPL
jgi:hypothetical protein